MTLISIIFCLFAERFIGSLEDYRSFAWFDRFVRWILSHAPANNAAYNWMALIVSLGSVTLLISYVYYALFDWFALAGFLFGMVVLFYCLGPRSFYEKLKEFLRASESGNLESAYWYVEDLIGRSLTDEEKKRLPYTVVESLFVLAHERILGVIFWFAFFGPLGAVLFRLSNELNKKYASEPLNTSASFANAVRKTNFIISWVPARLCALAYIVTGNFVDGMASFKNKGTMCSTRWRNANDCILAACGSGAIGLHANDTGRDYTIVATGFSLVRRAIVFSVGVIALLTLFGVLA